MTVWMCEELPEDGVAKDKDDDVDEESGIVIAAATHFPKLPLQPVPQLLEFPPQYPKCEQQSSNVHRGR
jgi:hypothetical protein